RVAARASGRRPNTVAGFPKRRSVDTPMPAARTRAHDREVQSYGVVWQEGGLPLATGRLELLARGIRLDGRADSRRCSRELSYESLVAVRVGRAAAERLCQRPTLILERRSGLPIRIATVTQSSLVAEIAERLAALRLGAEAERRLAVVVPLREGAAEAVRTLLEAGPPFDPE